MQVAALVWEGQTNREIASTIGTTEQVVKNYLRNTFDKLGVWSRLELAIYVARHGGDRAGAMRLSCARTMGRLGLLPRSADESLAVPNRRQPTRNLIAALGRFSCCPRARYGACARFGMTMR
jgi:hypothetical protein